MSAADERDTPAQAARQRAMIAELEARLAHFERLTAQIRESLPEHHAQDLTRIEQGIGSLAQRIGALAREIGRAGQEGERVARSASPTVPPTEDEPWDPQSAEELMRVYEAVGAEAAAPEPRVTAHPGLWSSQRAAAPAACEPQLRDASWLEARFAEIATLIERASVDVDPHPALASLERRLDQFEQRLNNALGDIASGVGRGDLKLIDAHLVEFASQVDTVRQQLGRLDTIDAQLRELAHTFEGAEPARAEPSARSEDAVTELIASAAEAAASKVAQSLPALASPALGENRISALEALVRDHVAERRRSEEATTGVLHSIEDALVRIVDRLEAIEAMKALPAACDDGEARACDGLQAEHDRLAEAYAMGARVLGQRALQPTLDAADYIAAQRQQKRATSTDLAAQRAIDDWPTQEETEGQELRAREWRAKLKAQALWQASGGATEERSPNSLGQEQLGQGRVRTWALAKAGRLRARLLIGGVMALLFGAGFMAVEAMLATPPPRAVQGQDGVGEPESRSGNAGFSRSRGDGQGGAAPLPQSAPRRPVPDAASEDAGEGAAAPTPRLERLQRATAALPTSGALPFTSPSGDSTGAAPAAAPATTARFAEIPSPGEAESEFEIATRFAEGRGVPLDPRQAFVWLERAAARGLPAAQFRLAVAFEKGIGVAIDRERAKVWYGRAAEQGHVGAMHNLGLLHAGERQADYATAARWFAQAAERGFVDSQFNLAVLLESGRGVTKDLKGAYIWFARAAKAGDAVAARRREQVAAHLQPAELTAAEQTIAAWQPTGTEAASPVRTGASR